MPRPDSTTPNRTPLRLAVTSVPTLRQRYLSVINRSTRSLFSLDADTLSLTTYYWYVVILLRLVHC
jgi:hypothetical protein